MASNIPKPTQCSEEFLVNYIMDIPDIGAALRVMMSWKVDAKGVQNLDEAKDRLIKFVRSFFKRDKPPEDDLKLSSASNDKVRKKLLKKLQKTQELCRSLPDNIQVNLERSFQNVVGQMSDKKEALQKGESIILVAGEVGAGKSSLINLLLGVQLFPTDSLRCTNTICEIRCSNRKEAICRYGVNLSESEERQRRVAPKVIKLETLKGLQEFKDCLVECNEDENSPYERIELYYPFKSMAEEIVLVDTPGIEGGGNVDQGLEKYLSQAFGFIYVINTNAAGGVQQGRLGHLLKTVANCSDDFSPEASLFVGNKWENIKREEREDVKRDIFSKLKIVYPGIKEKQIHYMSVKKCQEFYLSHKSYIDEHKVLMDMVRDLIPNSMRHGLTSHYWWLSHFLKRTSYLIHVASMQHSKTREELEKQRTGLAMQVEKLKQNTDENIDKLRHKIGYEVYRITDKLKHIMKSKEMLDNLCCWEGSQECPKVQNKWKRTVDEAAVKISDKLTHFIDKWERENGVLRSIDDDIVEVFSKQLGLMEHQIKELEDAILENRGGIVNKTLRPAPIKGWWRKPKDRKIEVTYKTLGGAVSCSGMLDTNRKEVKTIFKDMTERNKHRKMAEATMLYLETILNHRDLQSKLSKFFSRFTKDIDKAAEWIPRFLRADEQLIETISQRLINITNSQFTKFREDAQQLSSKLDILYVNDLMKWDYDMSELSVTPDQLGHGSFADVFRAVIKRKNRDVAVKICRDSVNQSTVSDMLTEDRTMRDLKHPNVIRYYGATYKRAGKCIRWIMIMDMCDTTLKHVYTGDDRQERNIAGLCPPDHPNRARAVGMMLDYALQMCEGLAYIHGKGYTHRDMKLENILLKKGVIQITDVGVAKMTNILANTCNGSPAYMAPEVLTGGRSQTDKVDIYSLSLMLWEMWFGRDITVDMNREILGFDFHGDALSKLKERQSDPTGGFRPSLKLANRPDDRYIDMLQQCWSFEPDARLSAEELVAFHKKFLRNNTY